MANFIRLIGASMCISALSWYMNMEPTHFWIWAVGDFVDGYRGEPAHMHYRPKGQQMPRYRLKDRDKEDY